MTGAIIHLTSAHGAPGVTTTAMLIAASWPGSVVIEADPGGGVIGARHDLGADPGLMSLAGVLRHGPTEVALEDHAQRLAGGVDVVCAPPSGEHVASALRRIATRDVANALRGCGRPLLVDGGRAQPGPVGHDLMAHADLVVWFCRSDLAELAVLRQRIARCGGQRVALVGEDPYDAAEVSHALGGLAVTPVPLDDGAASVVTRGAPRRRLRRSRLRRAVAELVEVLMEDLAAGRPTGRSRDDTYRHLDERAQVPVTDTGDVFA
ncbi:MAG: hypothetical protein RIE08_02300 [Acidimicrobiales bacterium]